MPPFIRIQNISKKYGVLQAVDAVSFDLEKGELFSLLGPSGCGKTTLLRILAGFEVPTSGLVEIDGQNMANVDPADRPVNIMFQNYALFPHMSVFNNIAYGLQRASLAKNEINHRVEDLLKLVHLTGMGERKPATLSGGQRQRVALARALARRPKLLLLDEPLAALDKKLRSDTQFELVNIQEKLGTTFIVVTHDQEEAMTLSTRIGVMNEGQLVQLATPNEIYENPRTRFIADFVGDISFVPAKINRQDGDYWLMDAAVPIYAACEHNLEAGKSITLAIRPEKITLTPEASGKINEFPVRIDDWAFYGAGTQYRVTGPGGIKLKLFQSHNQPSNAQLRPDQIETGFIHFAPESIIILEDK
ncbi:ABC transporter ATP-binding protein [Alphaproteobacteria bacterium]|nr:ABC transporter ATP-binding protein [Alphaproteobacteria bacterium]